MKKYLSILLMSVLIFGAVLPCVTAGAQANSGDNSTIEDETTVVNVSDGTNDNSVEKEDTIVADRSVVNDTTIISTDDDTYNSNNDYNYVSSDDDTNTSVNTEDNSIIANNSSVVQYVETTQVNIDNSQKITVDVKNDNSVVNNIYFESKADSGKAKVVIEDLKKGTDLVEKPAGNVYKSFNIRIDNVNVNNNIEDAAVNFKVEKKWLKANGLDESSIVLNMYDDGKWVEVPITLTSEDSQYIYFTAEVSKYSTFAITSNTITVDKVLKQSNVTENSSSEKTDEITKNDIIHILEMILEYLKGN